MAFLNAALKITRNSTLNAVRRPSKQCNDWGTRCFVFIATCICFFAIGLQQAHGQVQTASITGVVTDPSGGAIPGARVVATDVSTGFTYPTTSNSAGIYVLENLLPATYKITVTTAGFEQLSRSDITLVVAQRATINAQMTIGATTQTVSVTGVAPLLQMEDATTVESISREVIDYFPVYGRNVFNLAYIAPGVVQAPGVAFSNGGGNAYIVNGGRDSTVDVLVDGVAIDLGGASGGPQLTPQEDTIQEYTLQANNYSAEQGATGSSVVNVATRSGTNRFHGSVFWFIQNSAVNANNWFNDRGHVPIPGSKTNDPGVTVGGPVQKNKMFFFGHYEETITRAAASGILAGVPSAAERTGNFGELCGYAGGTFNSSGACSVASGQLWDPYSSFLNSTTGQRNLGAIIPYNNMATYTSPGTPANNGLLAGTPYALAATPGNLINPVASKVFQYYPLPNLNVGNSSYNPYTNWGGATINPSNAYYYDWRVDRQFTDMTHFSVHMGYNHIWNTSGNAWNSPMYPTSPPGDQGAQQPTITLTHSFSPTFVVTATYGFARFSWFRGFIGSEFPSFNAINTLGLPAYIQDAGYNGPPAFNLGGGYSSVAGQSIGALAFGNTWHFDEEDHNPSVKFNKVHGAHDLAFGGENRVYRITWTQPGYPTGEFGAWSQAGTARTPASGTGGDALASMLTGLPAGTWAFEIPATTFTQNWYWAAYLQDNWHVRSNLTLNLGLRWDVYCAGTDRFNQQDWINPNLVNPVSSNNFALSSSAASVLSNAGFTVPNLSTIHGGYVYAGVNGNPRTMVNNNYLGGFGPRLGLAYHLRNRTVLRAGYGIFHAEGYYGTHGSVSGYGDNGYDQITTGLQTYQNNGYTPAYSLSNPFPGSGFSTAVPGGITPQTGNKLGALENLGSGLTGLTRNENQLPYMQEWNIGFQHQFGSYLVEVNYVGTKGTHLFFDGSGNMNYLGPQAQNFTAAQISALTTQVANPFKGLLGPGTTLNNASTAAAYTFLLPFPASGGMTQYSPPQANSNYNSLQLKLEKRFSHGLLVQASYTWSKFLDDSDGAGGTTYTAEDPNDLRLQYSLAEADLPQVLNFDYVYHLPIGRGLRIGNSWSSPLDMILGGWQTQGYWRFDDGMPMGITANSSTPVLSWGTQRPNLSAKLIRNKSSVNSMVAQYFANPQVATAPPAYTLGNAPRIMNVFAPGSRNANLSLFKEIPIRKGLGEQGRLQLRIETFNALNHPQFGMPNRAVGNASFGLVTSQANSPRQVQLAAKIYW